MDLSGKDYFSRKEAAHYCCVSESQFERKEIEYGIPRIPFMGKLIYRRVDLQRLIETEWQRFATLEATGSLTTARAESGEGRVAAELERFRKKMQRKNSKSSSECSVRASG